MPVIIKDFLMFKASKDPQVMNMQIFRYCKPLVKTNKSLADELKSTNKLFTHKSF